MGWSCLSTAGSRPSEFAPDRRKWLTVGPRGGCKCHVATEIVLHQRQGEIHPSGHASGRVEAAVSQKDRIGIDLDRRIAPRQLMAESPMRHGAATI
jgi:hypothetical protein